MSTSQGSYVVIARFTLKPGQRDAFLKLAHEDARQSVANEVGCQHFEVLLAEHEPNVVALREVYHDRAAFEHHLQTAHYVPFRDGTPALIEGEPTVSTYHSESLA